MCPANLIISEKGDIKLVDDVVLKRSSEFLSKDYIVAFSPQKLSALQGKRKRKIDLGRESAWAIGMTALCAAACCEISVFYDLAKKTVKSEAISRKIEKLSLRGYSKYVKGVIKQCLEPNESDRVDLDALHEFIEPFSVHGVSSNKQEVNKKSFVQMAASGNFQLLEKNQKLSKSQLFKTK